MKSVERADDGRGTWTPKAAQTANDRRDTGGPYVTQRAPDRRDTQTPDAAQAANDQRRAWGPNIAQRVNDRRRAWAPYVAIALLTLLAVAEAVMRARNAPGLFLSETEPDWAGMSETVSVPVGTSGSGPTPMPRPGGSGLTQEIVIFPLLALATTLPLGLLRNQRVTAGLLVSGASLLSIGAFNTFTVAGLVAQFVAAYRLGGPPRRAVLITSPFPALAVALEMTDHPAVDSVRLLTLLLACLIPAAALAGIARRARGQARADTAARQVIAESLLEHTARGERARIARELHDVVAHHISMVAVQAETARLAVPGMPEAGAERLSAIGDTARAALTEMRRLLGVLREDAETETTWRPQPGLRLDELNELLDESREASGSVTRLILRGTPVELDPGVELAAYRIVQEALTNARRHAPGAAVDVELDYTGDDLRIRIRDNGPGPGEHTPNEHGPAGHAPNEQGQAGQGPNRHAAAGHVVGGHGLAGMRERAAAVGGKLRTGPAPGGGFLVEADLPGRGGS